jgi:hypothetical protein
MMPQGQIRLHKEKGDGRVPATPGFIATSSSVRLNILHAKRIFRAPVTF